MKPESMDAVFLALAHASRRRILDILQARPGMTVQELCDFFPVSRIALLKHVRVLEKANLIVSRREGRTRPLYFNAIPIQMIYDRWTSEFAALWSEKLTRIKYRVEALAAPPPAKKTRSRRRA